jgi:GNAT superfamily N-acetyltransferase
VHPDVSDEGLESEILNWAIGRGQEIAAEKGIANLPFYPGAHEYQIHLIALLEDLGFQRSGVWSGAYLARSLDTLPDEPSLPAMYEIRPAGCEMEAEEYAQLQRAVFNSNHMTLEWRQRVVQMPQYVPDLDLVAVTPDGRLAGLCVCWLRPHWGAGLIDAMGVHPEFRRQGLGRALLLDGLRRMRASGGQTAFVHTGSKNDPARLLYESVGFRQKYLLHSFSRPAQL